MNDYVLETVGLTKKYGTLTALSDVNIRLRRGHIYGFVGSNGAGKTTLMRIVAGLARPTSGRISLFGAQNERENMENRRRAGFIIEQPVFYGDMTAVQNLKAQGILQGKLSNSGKSALKADRKKIQELLSMAGLSGDTQRKRLRNYSTGMKQRYGIAFALLGNPELLVLDEPFNGLDVEGMDDITKLFSGLCEENGMTIFISSHQLNRLHQLATDFIFIHNGKIIEEIDGAQLDIRCRSRDERDLENYFRNLINPDKRRRRGENDARIDEV
jgi:ABC-2 type transport system ATP-binding protein